MTKLRRWVILSAMQLRNNNYNTKYDRPIDGVVCIVGDTHGSWDQLFHKLDHCEIDNCTLIHVGDIGIGFKSPHKQEREIELLNNRFQKRNINFYGVAGNHDDPAYFQGQINFPHFKLLPDYTYLNINGEIFLFVGGAVSVDRRIRIPNISWWEGEEFVLNLPELIKPCDVLITHLAPTWNGPFDKQGIQSWCEKDPTLWEECKQERLALDELIKLCRPKKHFCGHFHTFAQCEHGGCLSRILDILEIIEYRP